MKLYAGVYSYLESKMLEELMELVMQQIYAMWNEF